MKKRYPQYLSQPPMILNFEPDEQMIFLTFLSMAFVIGGITWLFLIIVPYLYVKAKRKCARGFLKHIFYFVGLIRFDGYPSYYESEFRE